MFFKFPQLLALTFFIPEEFALNLFGLIMQPYRLLLLAAFVPAMLRLHGEKRFNLFDASMALLIVPLVASMIYNHGLGPGLASGGLAALEIVGSYFIARAYLSAPSKVGEFIGAWIALAMIFWPVLIAESVLHVYLFHPLISSLTGLHYSAADTLYQANYESLSRLGLLRAMGPFSHPILCGVAYAAFVPYTLLNYKGVRRIVSVATLVSGALATVSSTALLMIVVSLAGCGTLLWFSRRMWQAPLRSLALFVLPVYVCVTLLSNRGPFVILSTIFAFNAWTGYYRTLIWTYGSANMWSHPVFGIGYHDWLRPFWMSSSVDAYWLLIGMRHGALALGLFAGVCIVAFGRIFSAYGHVAWKSERIRINGAVWIPTLLGLATGGITVDYWGPMAMIIPVVLGIAINFERTLPRTRGGLSPAWRAVKRDMHPDRG